MIFRYVIVCIGLLVVFVVQWHVSDIRHCTFFSKCAVALHFRSGSALTEDVVAMIVYLGSFGALHYRSWWRDGARLNKRHRPVLDVPDWLRDAMESSGPDGRAVLAQNNKSVYSGAASGINQDRVLVHGLLLLMPRKHIDVFADLSKKEEVQAAFLGKPPDLYSLEIKDACVFSEPAPVLCKEDGTRINFRHMFWPSTDDLHSLAFSDGRSRLSCVFRFRCCDYFDVLWWR